MYNSLVESHYFTEVFLGWLLCRDLKWTISDTISGTEPVTGLGEGTTLHCPTIGMASSEARVFQPT